MKKMCVMLCFLCFLSSSLFAKEINIQDLIHETQRVEQSDHRFRLIWWIPTDYWKVLFQRNPNLSEKHKTEIQEVLSHYILISVADAALGDDTSLSFLSRKEIISKISITTDGKKIYPPLKGNEISKEAKKIISELRPVLASVLGQFGKGFHFIVFKDEDKRGNLVLNPKEKGTLTVKYGEDKVIWHLPLGSLLPPKYDVQSGEKFPGNYDFNPFTGKPLKLTMKQ